MIVVGREGMHAGVTHMHARPQPHELKKKKTHTLIHTQQVQGRA